MVYRSIYKFIIIYLICLYPLNIYSNIIYDKNDIVISDIDLNYYKQVYFENFGERLNDQSAIKNIVLIKNVIENFKKNNPVFLKKIDDLLLVEYGNEKMNIPILRDFIRYFKIKNEFIYEFYDKKFTINDLNNIFNSFTKIELPISDNDCMTILKLVDFKYNASFLDNFYENLKKETKKYEVIIDDYKYDICIDSKTNQIFENNILRYIDLKTTDDFKKFVYERQK